jgi:PAS domain S-box-containing protein
MVMVKRNSPGIIVRLSNLIVLQVLFIFAALVLVLFPPQQNSDYPELSDQIQADVRRVREALPSQIEFQPNDGTGWQSKLKSIVDGDLPVMAAAVYLVPAGVNAGDVTQSFWYSRTRPPAGGEKTGDVESKMPTSNFDASVLRYVATRQDGFTFTTMADPEHSVLVQRLSGNDDSAAVLATFVHHDIYVSGRSQLQYAVLLLFLVSTLISLLTIHLIFRRLNAPIRQLISGMEKTARGELHHLVVANTDKELSRLFDAFNSMARTLWDNHKSLRQYNVWLRESNLSLLKSQLFLTTMVQSSPMSILVTSPEGKILLYNQAAASAFGYDAESLIGGEIDSLLQLSSPEILERANDYPGVEGLCRRSDGEFFPAFVVKSPVCLGRDEPQAYLYQLNDITESKSFQEMMIRIDRYCTRGEMAGDIAHEMNNHLAVLSGNLELLPLLLKKGNEEKLGDRIELMRKTIEKIVKFGNGLMDSPPDETEFEIGNVNQVVENVLAFLRPQNKFDNIDIAVSLAHEVPAALFDLAQVQQLLVNLMYNAAEALYDCEGPRRIEVRTTVGESGDGRIVRLDVRDSGPGVCEEKVASLFAERFTTKRKGHGIGLVTCRKIAEAHGARVGYQYDRGAVFTFELPVKHSIADSDRTTPAASTEVSSP